MSVTKEDLECMDSDTAKAEFAARRVMAKEEEENALRQERNEQRRLASNEPNFAMYNWVMTSVDFRDMKFERMQDLSNTMWRYVYPYVKTLISDRQKLINFIKVIGDNNIIPHNIREIMDRDDPETMATEALEKVAEMAKKRSKLNKYNAKAGKSKLIV